MLQTPVRPIRTELRTLGCRLNQAESDEIRAAFAARGVEVTSAGPADVVVVNTCTVTAEASKASRKLIRRSIAERPDARIIVTGCYAVAAPEAVAAIPGVDLVVPNKDKNLIAARIADPAEVSSGAAVCRVRANLRIQTGCDEACSFCIVPQTRGGLCSRPAQEVIDSARTMAAGGTREVILTGVHLGKYGRDRGDGIDLAGLITRLSAVEDLDRIRLSSVEATQVDERLVEVLATNQKLCRHLHLPLQTGDPGLWRAMRRPGTLDGFLQVVRRVRDAIDDVSLTTDVMVGFPGEDDRAFQNTLEVVGRVGFRKLHVFRFSPRPGTPAAFLTSRVDPAGVRDRSQELRRLGDRIRRNWMLEQIGNRVSVLIEEAGPVRADAEVSGLSGLTGNYLRVRTFGGARLVGSTADVLVTSAGKEDVEGAIVGRLPVLQDR